MRGAQSPHFVGVRCQVLGRGHRGLLLHLVEEKVWLPAGVVVANLAGKVCIPSRVDADA